MFAFTLPFSMTSLKVLHLILSHSQVSVVGCCIMVLKCFFFTPELHLWLLIALLQLEYPIKIEFVSTFDYVFELEQF